MTASRSLLNSRCISDEDGTSIDDLHVVRMLIEKNIKNSTNKSELLKSWTQNEYALQRLWQFPEDSTYHRWWYMLGCTCPKMDNDYRLGLEDKITNSDCAVHGVHND